MTVFYPDTTFLLVFMHNDTGYNNHIVGQNHHKKGVKPL